MRTRPLKVALAFGIIFASFAQAETASTPDTLGKYFSKSTYSEQALPGFAEHKDQLPIPIFDSRPDYIDFYYKAWEIGFSNFKKPQSTSPFVSNFIDEAFNENIFLWDMSFSTMWGNYAHHIFPGIEGLDNFYRMQLPDGEIVREIAEKDGRLGVAGWSEPGTEGSLNHPILAWAELEYFYLSGDTKRLEKVYLPLQKYRESFSKIRDPETCLYKTDKAAMDDSPRNEKLLYGVDVAAEMVIFDRWLAEIARHLGKSEDVTFYLDRARSYSHHINDLLWDEETGFYYDWSVDGGHLKMRTIAAFWTMLGEIPNRRQLDRLIAHLENPNSFKTAHRVPTHPVDEIGFDGDYWAGGVWVPTNTMVLAGLEKYGKNDLAHEIAMNHLDGTTAVFRKTGTAWENYHPLELARGGESRPDFVGWSGLAPINYLIKYAIGIRINASENTITWRLKEKGRHGIENLTYGFGTEKLNNISLVFEPSEEGSRISVECEKPFTLELRYDDRQAIHNVRCGTIIALQ